MTQMEFVMVTPRAITVAVNDMITIGGAIDGGNDETLTALQARVNFGDYYVALARHSQ